MARPLGDSSANIMPSPAEGIETGAGQKRKLDSARDSGIGLNDDTDSDEAIPGGTPIDKNPDQIRRMINAFIENGEMKVGQFQDKIGVSSNAYLRFMKQSGPTKGLGCDTYQNAWEFFKKRELKGIPLPRKKAKTSKNSDDSKSKSSKGAAKKGSGDIDISDIHLDGEDTDSVPIHDTCSEIRKKISAYLRKPNVTSTQFCRDLAGQYHTKQDSKVSTSQLQQFRGKSKPDEGNTSAVYYAAYVFFEKIRVKEGKPKSKHRLEMEKRWPKGARTNIDLHKRLVFSVSRDLR